MQVRRSKLFQNLPLPSSISTSGSTIPKWPLTICGRGEKKKQKKPYKSEKYKKNLKVLRIKELKSWNPTPHSYYKSTCKCPLKVPPVKWLCYRKTFTHKQKGRRVLSKINKQPFSQCKGIKLKYNYDFKKFYINIMNDRDYLKSCIYGLVLWHINHCRLFNAKSSLYIYIKYIWFGLVGFYGISTIVGYLSQILFIYTHIY